MNSRLLTKHFQSTFVQSLLARCAFGANGLTEAQVESTLYGEWRLEDMMDPALRHCSLAATWDDIVQDQNPAEKVQRFFTGGLGKRMIPRVFETWVCDIEDKCAPRFPYALDPMCYVFNEQTLKFRPVALNSRLKFVDVSPRA